MPEGTSLMDLLLVWALRIAAALLVFFIGRIIANWIVRFTRRHMENRKLDALIVNFVSNILNWALLLLVITMALSQLGVDTTAMIALLGAAGIAIGLALQDSMKNFASGVLLIMFRPFATGHFVEAAGTSGVVEKITLFTSTLLTLDNREVIVPNSAIYNNNITNYSARAAAAHRHGIWCFVRRRPAPGQGTARANCGGRPAYPGRSRRRSLSSANWATAA